MLAGVGDALVQAVTASSAFDGVGVEVHENAEAALSRLRSAPQSAGDLLVIGPAVESPLRIGQRARGIAGELSLLFLTERGGEAPLRAAALVSPFVGSDLVCISVEDRGAVIELILKQHEKARRLARHRTTTAVASSLLDAAPSRESGVVLEQLLDHAPIGVLVVDPEGLVRAWNPKATVLFGVKEQHALGRRLTELMPRGEDARLDDLLQRIFAGPDPTGEPKSDPVLRAVFELRSKSAQYAMFTISGLGDHAALRAMVLVHDVTEQVLVRRALEHAVEGIARVDERGALTSVNSAYAAIYGRHADEMIGEDWVHGILADDRPRLAAAEARMRAAGKAEVEVRGIRSDGSPFYAQMLLIPSVDGHHCFAKDVSQQKEMQAKLLIADHMTSIGTLAAGVAHEVNNPLAYVSANLEMMAEEVVDEGLREMVAEAREGVERIRRIVSDLKSFARPDERKPALIDVRDVLDLCAKIANNEIKHRARLVKRYGEVPRVAADEAQLGQVFVNLLANAARAIPEGHVAEHEIRIVTATEASGRSLVEIQDTGAGIPAEHLPRIFEPFFTTRQLGTGIGLGLSICHGIITSLGGEITVRSAIGRGTTFRIALPAAATTPVEASTPQVASVASAVSGTVLVVDDDPGVSGSLKRILRGHRVTIAQGGSEALRILETESFDVILCDVMMPDVTGMEVHRELATTRPDCLERLVFITGGVFTPAARRFLEQVANERVEKPFDLPAIRALVTRYVARFSRESSTAPEAGAQHPLRGLTSVPR